MTAQVVPAIKLNNGVTIPQLGLGVFQVADGETAQVVKSALDIGYRHIDTAAIYGNESGVGQGIAQSGVPREEIFVTSKVWPANYGYDQTLAAFDESMKKLGLEKLDLYLLHWPTKDAQAWMDSWKALEKLYADGRVRAIGVSNFTPGNLDLLINESDVTPVLNQVEVHPRFQNRTILAADQELGIATEAWSPLGKGTDLEQADLVQIAGQVGKTVPQVILRWHLQAGRIVIPKSVNPSRQKENFEVFDFELSPEQIKIIDGLDTGTRLGPDPDDFHP